MEIEIYIYICNICIYIYKYFLSSSNLDAHKRIIWLHQPLTWIEKELVGLVSKQFFFNQVFIEKTGG